MKGFRFFAQDNLVFVIVVLAFAFTAWAVWFDNHVGNACVAAKHSWWFCRHFGIFWWVFS